MIENNEYNNIIDINESRFMNNNGGITMNYFENNETRAWYTTENCQNTEQTKLTGTKRGITEKLKAFILSLTVSDTRSSASVK